MPSKVKAIGIKPYSNLRYGNKKVEEALNETIKRNLLFQQFTKLMKQLLKETHNYSLLSLSAKRVGSGNRYRDKHEMLSCND